MTDDYTVPPVTTTLLDVDEAPDREGLGRSILKAIGAIEETGWPVSGLITTLVWVSDEFYMNDSKLKPGQESPDHTRGELRVPAHEERYWFVRAAHPDLRLGLRVGWKEGLTPKGGRSFKFESAFCADPIGQPVELFVDYSLAASDLKRQKDEPEWAYEDRVTRMQREALRRDEEYNLGHVHQAKRFVFTKSGDFETWLSEANEMVAKANERKGIAA